MWEELFSAFQYQTSREGRRERRLGPEDGKCQTRGGKTKKGELDANVNTSSARNRGQFYWEGVNVGASDGCSVLGGTRRFNCKSAAARAEIRMSTFKMDSLLTSAVLMSFSASGPAEMDGQIPAGNRTGELAESEFGVSETERNSKPVGIGSPANVARGEVSQGSVGMSKCSGKVPEFQIRSFEIADFTS